jgi:hypothetical protein
MQTSLSTAVGAALLCMALGIGPAISAPQEGAMPSAPSAAPGVQGAGGMKGGAEAPNVMPQGNPDAPSSSANAPSRGVGKAMEGRQDDIGDVQGKSDRKAVGSEQPANNDAEGRDQKATTESADRDRDGTADKTHDKKGKSARIDSEQKEKVRSYFSKERPTAHRVEKSRVRVSIGIGIPASIALVPLPPGIVVVAADCPLEYFVWGDDVVLVDSCSREVVDIIPNIG